MDFSQPQKADGDSVGLRKFGDHASTRSAIYDNALKAVSSMAPAENTRFRLSIADPQYSGADEYTPAEHKKSLLHGKSLSKKISATLNLHDVTTNQLVDSRHVSLGSIPHLTDHGTFSLDGIPSAMSSQFRLLPGVYVRRKDNDEVEGHVVHFPGEGISHRIRLDQGTGVFKIDVGQAEIPAAAALKAMGLNDADLVQAIGDKLAKVNLEAVKPQHLDKLYEKFGPRNKPASDDAAKIAAVAKAMGGKVDPWVVNKTLGIKEDTYGPKMFLSTLKKTLAVARGEQEADDRDSPAYQAVWGPEHLIAERITRSRALNDALWRATNAGSLKGILPGMLNQHIKALFMSSGLAQMPEGVSAAEYLDHGSRISKVGEGGLGRSSDAVPKSSRNLSPGQFLFVDPVKTPECFDADTEVLTHSGWKKWPDVTEDDELACRVGKKTEFKKPYKVHSYEFDGHLVGCDEGLVRFLVTGNHRMWVCQFDSTWRFVNASEAYGIAAVYDSSLDASAVSQYVPGSAWKRTKYQGRVYCATVEGGLLFCRRNSGVGFWSGNSESVGVDLRVAFGTRLGSDKRIYAPVRDAATGKLVYRSPQQLADASVAFPVTYEKAGPDEQVPAIVGGKLGYVKKREAAYVAPSMEQTFSPLSNMVPYKSSAKPQRVSMGARFIAQALPLVNPEAPLVRAALPGDANKSFEELYGRYMGTAWAKPDVGTVVDVGPDSISVKYDKLGKVEHGIYNNLPIGRKSPLHSTPIVKVGDRITPGSMLARSNFTDDKGHAAYGLNARVAFYPYLRGKPTYEDAFAVSESFAKRATSDHLYRHDLDYSDDSIIPTKSAFVAAFPTALDRNKLKDYDETGAILPGTKVEPGQPLALAVRKKAPEFGLSKGRKAGLTDASLVWDDSVPGVVADVAKTKSGLVVTVKASKPLKEADKLCYDPETEVLTRTGWKPVASVNTDDEVASLNPETRCLEYIRPIATTTYDHAGRMYRVASTQVDLLVTDNHRLFVDFGSKNRYSKYALVEARDVFGRRYRMLRNAEWRGGVSPTEVVLPGVTVKAGQGGVTTRLIPDVVVPASTYAMILGMYLSEGNRVDDTESGSYGFDLTQIKQPNRDAMIAALSAAGVKFGDSSSGSKVRVYSKVWSEHLKQFGLSHEKFIPEEVFGWGTDLLKILFQWLMWGDGHSKKGVPINYCTTSRRLADGVQRLALHLGISANIDSKPATTVVIGGKTCQAREVFYVRIYNTKNRPSINHPHVHKQSAQTEEWADYDGTVHCVTLPKNHVLYVRRNGKPVWCGNSNRFGGKGVCHIIPDHEMPTGEDGKPFDVLISPLAMTSRINPSMKVETALGKLAAMTGKPILASDFRGGQDNAREAYDKLRAAGISPTEMVTDPKTGKSVKAFTGTSYILKLHHMADDKVKARGLGGYDDAGLPMRGQSGKAARMSMGDTMALLGHGACFMGCVNVTTRDGDIEISKIVQKRKPVEVLSRNPDGSLEYKKVTNWFCRVASPDELLLVETTAATTRKVGLVGHFPAKRRAIRCTSNHGFYTPSGKVPAGKLVPGDKIYSPGTSVSDWQKAMIIGGLLGDSYAFHKETATEVIGWPKTGGIVMSHGHEQIDYLDWKVSKLLNLWCSSEQRKLSAGGFAKTPGKRARLFKHPATTKIIKRFYIGGKKTVPAGIVSEMGWYGIGIWFADDGSVTRNHGKTTSYKIHTCGFSKGEVETLSQEMRDFTGLPWESRCRKNGNSVYYELVLPKGGRGGDNLSRWAEMLAPYLPPMMGYKINHALPVGSAWNDLLAVGGAWAEEVEVVSVTPYTKAAYESYLVFDITVEDNHNYFANGVLVSNSEVLKDARFLRAQENDEFWLSYMGGYDPKPPTRYAQYDRFLSMLRGAGLDPQVSGTKTFLKPFGREKVKELTGNRVVTAPGTVDSYRGDKPISGGLMDPTLFGTKDGGETWARIDLDEPIPSPTFEEPIRRLLGLTKDRFRSILSGNDSFGKYKGPQAIVKALESYDLPAELAKARAEFASGRSTKREAAAKKIRYLKSAERLGVHPKDWIIDAVPVLPPSFRPVRRQGGGDLNVSDPNLLYADLLNSVTALKSLKSQVSDVGHERLTVYDATAAAYGLGQSVNPKYADKNLRGVLSDVFGDGSAKSSIVQQKLLGTPVNLSGRGVVLPNSDLDLDQIGVPADAAWDMYRPFIIRRMVRQGYPRVEALKRAEERDPVALSSLQEEMRNRPVIATRYPVLHKYGSQAFFPVLVPGSSIQTNVLVNKGYTLDHDGNCLDHDEIINLLLSQSDLHSTVKGRFFLSSLEKAMSTTNTAYVTTSSGDVSCRIKIGEFPRVGTPVAGKGGQEIYSVPEGVKVLTYNQDTGGSCYASINQFTVDKDHGILEVTTERGRTVKVSDNDSICAYDSSTDRVVRSPAAVGKLVPCLRKEPITGTKYDSDLGWWYGMLVSDGWVVNGTVGLAKLEDSKRLRFVDIARKKISENFTAIEYSHDNTSALGSGKKVHLNGVDLSRKVLPVLAEEPADGKRSALYKIIPADILDNGSEECLLGVLAGLMDGDGTLSWNTAATNRRLVARVNTSSKFLVTDVELLCRKLGIRTSLTVTPPRGMSNTAYVISMNPVDFYGVASRLPLAGEKEARVASEFCSAPRGSDKFDIIPVSESLTSFLRVSGLFAGKRPAEYQRLLTAAKSGVISRSVLANILDVVPDSVEHPHLQSTRKRVADTDVIWERIESVTQAGRADVYDLIVPETQVFAVGSGIVVWDTMSMHVPLSAEAVENAKQTMLPSTNLRSMASFKPTMYLPNMEFQQGLHWASTADDLNAPIEFRTLKDAEAAFKAGKIGMGTRVRILENKG